MLRTATPTHSPALAQESSKHPSALKSKTVPENTQSLVLPAHPPAAQPIVLYCGSHTRATRARKSHFSTQSSQFAPGFRAESELCIAVAFRTEFAGSGSRHTLQIADTARQCDP